MAMINDKEDDSMGLDESNRLSNEDLEALQSLQNGFQKCVVSKSAFGDLCYSFIILCCSFCACFQ